MERCYPITEGTNFQVSKDSIDFFNIEIGDYLTYCPNYGFIPLVFSGVNKVSGKYKVIGIIRKSNRKHWWEFWKRNIITAVDLKCIEN